MIIRNMVFAFAALVLSAPAFASDRVYCSESGSRCYRVQQDDRSWYSRYDYDDDYDRGRHRVCDSDGDRCYVSRSWHWDYRLYYRLHGYRWDN